MLQATGLAAAAGWSALALAKDDDKVKDKVKGKPPDPDDGLIALWNAELTASIAATSSAPTVAARAVSMLYEGIYNAWAAYDRDAAFTVASLLKRSRAEMKAGGKGIAVSQAAHGVLSSLFPARVALFDAALQRAMSGRSIELAAANAALLTGQQAASALLAYRLVDGSNQLASYGDLSGYAPVNGPDLLVDPSRWQPLRITDNDGSHPRVQQFVTPHWGQVTPFALLSRSQFRPAPGPGLPTWREMEQLIDFSACLDDDSKALIDFWAANPGSVAPAGQWTQIAVLVSDKDKNSLDDDVQLFFALGQALHDAGVAAWDTKRAYDTVRPITAIRHFYAGRTIASWAGPGLGTQLIRGEDWHPYQRFARPTPAFAEFVSGHSTFSAAAATVMAGLRGDSIKLNFSFPAFGVPFDPSSPTRDVSLQWKSLSEAADAAGLSRRLGGIHFERGDLGGRRLGRQVGQVVLARCEALFKGRDTRS